MSHKVLHLLSQRPSYTGSGVSLDAIVRAAAKAGWDQRVVVGTPRDDPAPSIGGLNPTHVLPLVFGDGDLDFPLPGMSDVMPYESTRWADMTPVQLDAYRTAWLRHLEPIVAQFKPDVIHSRHIWLLSSLVKNVAPDIPVVTHCHATGLRQMALCPHLADEVRTGCARNERFLVLHEGHADALAETLQIDRTRIHVVGAGYNSTVFHARGRTPSPNATGRTRPPHGAGDTPPARDLLYVGKYSHAKGVPQLLDAFERLARRQLDLRLHIAGEGAGPEAEALRKRMAAMAPRVVMHGQLDQPALAGLMRRCAVFVLPSFYEGLPLVVVEALACGCRVVCTDLPGLRSAFGNGPGSGIGATPIPALDRIPLPRLIGPDVPHTSDLPAFVDRLTAALDA
ncbi:MAG: glycosyltransferase family 4 protein, partial [Planctomycetota bacterium]